ncbi:RepA replication protein [Sphingomonas sp. S-NIH.Pt1_0416]|uniref:replication initiator protein A n=1 Tax=Sphingomonas sp. S-NIH.Pt1_0416 TaxID=1920123 RepID=UPI000F7D6AD3|nr:replication initiator protein A [Sphingomonas sp. S-NIH.Pt1_0416]RSU56219.1 RepA replication protein [Sphingomonas sp. S-NIH.Pt1_0416]
MTKKVRRKEGVRAGVLDQLDLFVTLPGDIPTHDEQEMMERPFFSLSKQRRSEPIDYQVQNGATTITVNVTAPVEIGIATIWDCDILIWAVSQLRAAKAAGQPTTPHFHVPLYELLRGIDRPTGGDEYRRIVEALERLSATLIRTNIRQGKKKRPEGFHWIERYSAPTDDLGRSTGVEFTISDWLYEGVLTDRLVLGIDRAYFKLTGGIERWLYRVVRKHGGHQAAGWAFTMKQLHHKSGSTQRVADFAKELRRAVERQRLPGYWLELVRNDEGEEVLNFTERCQLSTDHPGFQFKRLPRPPMGFPAD